MMFMNTAKTEYLTRMTLRASKLPLVYTLIGSILIGLAYIDNLFPITEYKSMFDLTDKIGEIFIALAILTYVYKFAVLFLRHYEKKLFERHRIAALILISIRKGLRIIFALATLNVIITLSCTE